MMEERRIEMRLKKLVYILMSVLLVVAITGAGATFAAGLGSKVSPGEIDDGVELLGDATITLEQAIAAAQAAEVGSLGEVDVEFYDGVLVFNIDIGDKDVKVDAADGTVLGYETDDVGDDELGGEDD